MKAHLSRLCVLSLLAAILFVAQLPQVAAQGGEPQYFAIRGAKVVPVSGPPMEDATVVVARGVILAVGGKDVAIPADAWVIEGKGLTVYPGLFDGLTDVGIPSASPAQGEGGPRGGGGTPTAKGPEDRPGATPWRTAANEVSLGDKRIESWRNAGFTTVVSSPKGGFFPGQAAVLDLAGERSGDLVVKAPVAIPISLNPSGGFGSGFPDSKMGVLGYVHQVWLDLDWSSKAGAIYEKNPRGISRPRYDRVETALAGALEDHALVLIPANSALELRRALVLVDRWKIPGAIVGAQMAYEVADELAAKKLPILVSLKWPEAEKDADPDDVPSLRDLRFRDKAPSSPAALAKAGVKFAFTSDGIASPAEIVKAVKKSVDAGLAPDAALRALTLSPAEIFGVADRTGSIEKGKIANLVVTDGDLFGEKTKIKMIFVDGKRFEIREPDRPKDPPKGDMTGKWTLKYTTPEGDEETTVDLTMAPDGTLSGTTTGKRGTATIITGYASAEKFSFTINMPIQGNNEDVIFTGTFEKDTMKGSIAVLSFSIDFTGTRPPATAGSISLGGVQ
ncbi:MAG: amidohydrolase family protein [Acidobacteria bacterium]|nr:amidohydrolase family protein [Acidobacteriota bacterium]MBS1865106.1 amidohydrolase family protein [Acidobacteriota bacterium]